MEKLQVRENTIKSIQEAVAYLFGLSVEELKQESKRREVAVPRQIAIYLAKQITDASLPEIGRLFGGKHHTTVRYSIAQIEERRLRGTPASIRLRSYTRMRILADVGLCSGGRDRHAEEL
jgi:chromosomal replication initiation ATPase DnaA